MSLEDWHRAEQQYENLGDRKWPTEPTEKMTHSIYYILRDLDQHSSGSISGLLNSDLKPIARQISAIDWAGRPGKPSHALKNHPEIYGLVRVIYKIATEQLDSEGINARAIRSTKLVLIAKKPSGIRPIAIGETLRRIAGRFIVKTLKDTIIERLGPHQYAMRSNGKTRPSNHCGSSM